MFLLMSQRMTPFIVVVVLVVVVVAVVVVAVVAVIAFLSFFFSFSVSYISSSIMRVLLLDCLFILRHPKLIHQGQPFNDMCLLPLI